MLKNDYKVMHVNWVSSTTDTDIVNAATKQTGEEAVWRMRVKKEYQPQHGTTLH
jgi:hypothetical protein